MPRNPDCSSCTWGHCSFSTCSKGVIPFSVRSSNETMFKVVKSPLKQNPIKQNEDTCKNGIPARQLWHRLTNQHHQSSRGSVLTLSDTCRRYHSTFARWEVAHFLVVHLLGRLWVHWERYRVGKTPVEFGVSQWQDFSGWKPEIWILFEERVNTKDYTKSENSYHRS